MRAIKHALTERYYSWRDAEVIAQSDPELNLTGKGPVYTPSFVEEEDVFEEEEVPEEVPEEAPAPRYKPSILRRRARRAHLQKKGDETETSIAAPVSPQSHMA